MRRRRKRRKINWAPIFLLLLVGNVLAGVLCSPLTSLHKVRVLGAQPNDRARIEAVLKSAAGIGWMRLNVASLESRLALKEDVLQVEVHRNLFGRGLVKVTYRKSIAQILGRKNVGMDDRGVMFSTDQPLSGLVTVKAPETALGASLTYATMWPAQRVVGLCQELAKDASLKDAVVRVDASGRLCLYRERAGEVVLGGTEDIPQKLAVLHRLLDADPNLLSRVDELNITDPEHPMQTPKSAKKKESP